MNYKWLALMISVSIACASCGEPCLWAQYLGNPGRTGYINCSELDSPELLWEITIDGGFTAPFIMEDMVVIPYEKCTSGCSLGYVPTMKTTVAMFDLLTGTLLQEIAVEDWLVSACPVGQKKVLLESNRMLYDIDFASASVSSISEAYIPSTVSYFPLHYPVVLQDKIMISTNQIVCFSRSDYRRLWDLKSSLGPLYPSDEELLNIAASEDVVYAILGGEEGERIWAVDSATGTFIWVSEPLDVLEIAVDGSMLFAGGDNRYSSNAKTGKVYSLDTKTGKVLWMFECEAVRSNIMVGPDAVYFTDDMTLYAVDKHTGKLEWKKERKNVWRLFATTHLIGTENSIICSDVLNLTSFSVEDGMQLWNVQFQDHIELSGKKTSPAVAQGILVVEKTELGKNVVAFASDPEIFLKQGDAFVFAGSKEKASDSYKKAATLYEKKGNLEKAEEIKKRISELGLPLETQSPTPSASPSPKPSPLTKKSVLLIASIIAIVVFIMIITYYFVKREQNKQNERS